MDSKHLHTSVEKRGRVVATDFSEDRDGEVMNVTGLDTQNFEKNPVLMFGHNHQILPVGKALNLKKENGQLTFEPAFSESTQMARDVKALWEEGILGAVSIGFIPKRMVDNVFVEAELIEISVVNVPANPNALAQAKSKGLNVELLDKATGSPDLATFEEKTAWDAQEAKKRLKALCGTDKESMNWDKYGQAFAYIDESDRKNYSSYKLPFADVEGEEVKAVWKGVTAAMGALMGAKSGLDIPEEDRRAAYNILKRYYGKFEKEAPEFKSFETIDEVIVSVQKGQITPEDGMQIVCALYSSEAKQKVEPVGESRVDAGEQDAQVLQEVMNILHPLVQEINKQTNGALKNIKPYVRTRKEH